MTQEIVNQITSLIRNNSYFTHDKYGDLTETTYSTRKHGSVYKEKHGKQDLIEGKRLKKLIKEKYSNEVKVEVCTADEWVILAIMPKKTK
jgi:uncharacterized protein YqfB (UPF0267 family)